MNKNVFLNVAERFKQQALVAGALATHISADFPCISSMENVAKFKKKNNLQHFFSHIWLNVMPNIGFFAQKRW
jgi:hypothetical protein